MSTSPGVWSIVLAGGSGIRVRPLIQSWLGYHKPKQYCTFVGTRSLLQHTVERAVRLCGDGQVVTVIDKTHWPHAAAQLSPASMRRVVVQPSNCETAPGIFLPLSYIRSWRD